MVESKYSFGPIIYLKHVKIFDNYVRDSILKAIIQQDLNNLAFIKLQETISGEEIIIITMGQVDRACTGRILNRP